MMNPFDAIETGFQKLEQRVENLPNVAEAAILRRLADMVPNIADIVVVSIQVELRRKADEIEQGKQAG